MRRLALEMVAFLLTPAPATAQGRPEILVELDRERIYEGESVTYRVP